MKRAATILGSLLLSCATTPPPKPPEPVGTGPAGASTAGEAPAVLPPVVDAASAYGRPEVTALRDQAKELLKQQYELSWRNWIAGDELDLASTYKGKEELFSAASLATVRSAREASTGDATRALRSLELYLAGEIIARETADLADQIANVESTATLTVDGETHTYRDLDRLLASEPSAAERAKLYAAEGPILAKLAPLAEQRLAKTESALKSLGYESYAALGAQLRDADLSALATLAEQTLDSTEATYRAAMEKLTQDELALPLAKVRRSDIPRLFRGARSDATFPPDRMLPGAREILAGLGIDLDSQKNVTLHTAPAPKKNPRAVCFPVDVPNDVRVSVKPSGGAEDYRSLLHELGHAEHFANVTRSEWEFQQLGNSTLTEAYAFLLEGVVDTPAWLTASAKLGAADAAKLVRSAATKRLYMLRRYAAKVLFETRWHSGALGTEKPEEAYRKALSRAYGFEMSSDDGKRYLSDHDDFFYSADYFRAWFLAAQLEQHLTKQFGAKWWTSRGAGDFLRSIWSEGSRPTADEIARRAGATALSPAALAEQLAARLK